MLRTLSFCCLLLLSGISSSSQTFDLIAEWEMGGMLTACAEGDDIYGLTLFDAVGYVDLSDPAAPECPFWLFSAVDPFKCFVRNGIAYVISAGSLGQGEAPTEISVIDFNEPDNPVELGSLVGDEGIDVAGYTGNIYVADGLLYLTVALDKVIIVDVSDPANMDIIDQTSNENPLGTPGVAVQNGRAYFSTDLGLQVYDCTDPTNLILINTVGSNYRGLTEDFANNRLFVTSASPGGIELFDITDPDNPEPLGNNLSGSTWDSPKYANNLVFENIGSEIIIYDVSANTWEILEILPSPTNEFFSTVVANSDYLLVSHFLGESVFVYGNESSTGIDITSTPEIFVYPNPSDDFIKVPVQGSDTYAYTIRNLSGSEVKRGMISGTTGTTLEVGALSAGIYTMVLENDQQITTTRFIKK
jgi:hypothetical protein